MARISSAAYVTAVLHLLQAYNAGDLDKCEQLLDPAIEWEGDAGFSGRREVRMMIEGMRQRWVEPRVRPEDFRERGGHVLMIVFFHEGAPGEPLAELRQSWIADVSDEGLITKVRAYPTPAEAARGLEALAPKIPA